MATAASVVFFPSLSISMTINTMSIHVPEGYRIASSNVKPGKGTCKCLMPATMKGALQPQCMRSIGYIFQALVVPSDPTNATSMPCRPRTTAFSATPSPCRSTARAPLDHLLAHECCLGSAPRGPRGRGQ
ncbi:hypothetical protein H310_03638 [Aphanomyces invadans]|uniref:Uncharacterized protein n=1 Tax=Aphanomyces invadans TaxID=157072 RepID=A0A024UIB3_9STRA|nr:hypothetical protein H310_03638 [Aphanomyces invadans]ETW06029.1 hypothetical protein H310_03638 [Aphanomyces invadans]|eukprot:XP_008865806.1 hypothetical protein H310_03638 [Aphanomyces invadans]